MLCLEQQQLALKPLLSGLLLQSIAPFSQIVPAAPASASPDKHQLTASKLVQQLDKILSERRDTVPLISDIGDCLFASLHAKPSLMLAPAFYASMGYAVPAALGVQAATGLRPVVLVGDGAFLMTGLELGHFSRYGFAPIIVLFNNQRWDMIDAFAPGLNCTDLHHWQYAELARSMGGHGMTVSNLEDFSQAFSLALESAKRFSLIEVMLPRGSRTDRLNNFAAGFKAAARAGQAAC